VLVLVRRGNEQTALAEFDKEKVKVYDEQLALSSPELWRGMDFCFLCFSCLLRFPSHLASQPLRL
jgi:hypothetical protein